MMSKQRSADIESCTVWWLLVIVELGRLKENGERTKKWGVGGRRERRARER